MIEYLSNTSARIVNIVGLPACGKSSICAELGKKGFEIHRPSDAIRRYAALHDRVLHGRQDYQTCHAEMIDIDPEAMIRSVLESDARYICLDGLRAPAAMRRLKQQYGQDEAISTALECPLEERFARSQADDTRHGHRRQEALEQFRLDELPDYHNDNPNMVSMDDMFREADYTVDAARALPEVWREVWGIVRGNIG